jgi:CRP-like cAMP-binding protein
MLPPHETIIREGDPGAGLYVVLRGEVKVSHGANGHAVSVATLGAAEAFGEIALLTRQPTSATVAASERGATLLFLQRDYFDRLIDAVPELRVYFENLSDNRLMDLRLSNVHSVVSDEIDVDVLI